MVGAFVMPRKKQDRALPPQTIQNMETALEQFMENMEKDNEELVLLVRKAQQDTKSDAERKEQRIAQLEKKCEFLTEQLQLTLSNSASLALQNVTPPQTAAIDTIRHEEKHTQRQEPIMEEPPMINSIHARYSELFMLYEEGKSIEMISKKLGMNKGEVQLIIQLAKQEAAVHA